MPLDRVRHPASSCHAPVDHIDRGMPPGKGGVNAPQRGAEGQRPLGGLADSPRPVGGGMTSVSPVGPQGNATLRGAAACAL